MSSDETQRNLDLFRDCLSSSLVQRYTVGHVKVSCKRKSRRKRNSIKFANHEAEVKERDQGGAEELADFVDYLATETFESFLGELQRLSYPAVQNDPRLAVKFGNPLESATLEQVLTSIPPSVAESLEAYGLLEEQSGLPKFLTPILQSYVAAVTATPPIWSTTCTSACEICERDWIPLSYHHLIPKQIHGKAIKRGWHEEWRLNSVAWLCRACHSFVHRIASNEELAKDYWTVERLMAREDVISWAKWVGRVRWKAR